MTPEGDPTWGNAYTFLAQARTQKLIVSYRMGKRDDANARAFVQDMRSRLVTVPEFATDGFGPYAGAVAAHFEAIDYGQVVKNYSRSRAVCTMANSRIIGTSPPAIPSACARPCTARRPWRRSVRATSRG